MNPARGPLKPQALEVLKSRGVPVQTIIDVGVNTVTPELVAAFPDRHHLLFEPVAEYAEAIERHYAKVPHELVCAAVSDTAGTVTLKTASKLQGQGISHSGMVAGPGQDGQDTRIVPMVRLDDFLRERGLPGPYLLKIDIDGHEMKVLRGAVETLKASSVVIVECPHHALPERLGHMMKSGFRLFDLVEPCYYDKVFWQCDAVFLREDLFAQKFQALGHTVVPGLYEMFR